MNTIENIFYKQIHINKTINTYLYLYIAIDINIMNSKCFKEGIINELIFGSFQESTMNIKM